VDTSDKLDGSEKKRQGQGERDSGRAQAAEKTKILKKVGARHGQNGKGLKRELPRANAKGRGETVICWKSRGGTVKRTRVRHTKKRAKRVKGGELMAEKDRERRQNPHKASCLR